MSYNIVSKQALGVTTDPKYIAAADSIANEFAKTGNWTDPAVVASFTAWANVSYDENGGAPGVEWFEQVVDDRWRNGPGCSTSITSSGCSVDSGQEAAMRAGLIVLGDQVTTAKATPAGKTRTVSMNRILPATRAPAPAATPPPASDAPPAPPPPPAPTGWWAGLSDTEKYEYVGIGVLGVAVIGGAAYYLLKKPKVAAAAAPVTAKANRRRHHARW